MEQSLRDLYLSCTGEATTPTALDSFDPTMLTGHERILIAGPRGCGRSTLAHDLLYHLREKIHFSCCMGRIESDPFKDCFDTDCRTETLDCQRLEKMKTSAKGSAQYCFFTLFNELSAMTNRDALLGWLNQDGSKTGAMLVGQTVPQEYKDNIDYMFLRREATHCNTVCKNYFCWMKASELENALSRLGPHEFLVGDFRRQKLYVYRAEVCRTMFTLGIPRKTCMVDAVQKEYCTELRQEIERLQAENRRLCEKLARIRIEASL